MRVIWSERALIHIEAIGAYLERRSPAGATRVLAAIARRVESLADHPHGGRIHGTRELVIPRTRYLVAYRLRDEEIEILAVIHGSQRWPRRL